MKNHIIVFAVAVGVLIIAVSMLVVLQAGVRNPDRIVFEPTTKEEQSFFDKLISGGSVVDKTAETSSKSVVQPTQTVEKSTLPEPVGETPAEVIPAAEVGASKVKPAVKEPIPVPIPAQSKPEKSLISSSSASFQERMEAGANLLAAGKYDRAMVEFSAVANLDPTSAEALIRLAEAQNYLKRYDQTLANLKAAEDLDATNSSIFLLRGKTDLRLERFSEAEASFARAGDAGIFYQAIMAAFYDRDAEAKKLFSQVAASQDTREAEQANIFLAAYAEYELFPDSPKTHIDTLLTRSFTSIGEYELAIAKVTPVVRDAPDYRDAWLLLGYAEFAREQYDEARQAFRTAVNLDPANPEAAYLLGRTHAKLGNYTEAERYLKLAQENNFSDPTELTRQLATVYFSAGKYLESADTYAILLKSGKTSPQDYVRPVYLYLEKVGDGRAAWNIVGPVLASHGDSAIIYNLAGWISIANGYLPEAKSYLDRALTLDPSLAAAHYNLGRYYEGVANTEDAQASYKKAFELDPTGAIGVLAAKNYNRLIKS